MCEPILFCRGNYFFFVGSTPATGCFMEEGEGGGCHGHPRPEIKTVPFSFVSCFDK